MALPTGLGKTLIAAVVMFNYFRWFPEGNVHLVQRLCLLSPDHGLRNEAESFHCLFGSYVLRSSIKSSCDVNYIDTLLFS